MLHSANCTLIVCDVLLIPSIQCAAYYARQFQRFGNLQILLSKTTETAPLANLLLVELIASC